MTTRAKLHTAWSSVLIDSTITGALTISRRRTFTAVNDVVVAAVPEGQLVWYDHFPPLGVSLTYSVTNGTTTETAVITVPARTDRRTWLKSGADPNLSMAVLHSQALVYGREKPRGVYDLVDGETFVTNGPMRRRTGTLGLVVDTAAARDNLEALIDSGPVYYQPPAWHEDPAGWLSLGSLQVARPSLSVPQRLFTVPFTGQAEPTFDTSRQVIPGWSWTDVAATYATWTATAAARTTWVDLVRFGVT